MVLRMIETLQKDLYRYTKSIKIKSVLKVYFFTPGFNYITWLRMTSKYNNFVFKYILFRKMIKFGIEIYPQTKIGEGFYIGHFGCITVHPKTKIGKNCNLSQGVTIGIINRGNKKGVPTIGDNVYIGSGAKILGNITIGSNVAIGANAVVLSDVPDNAVVAGIPAVIKSYNGSVGYVNNVSFE